MHRHSGSFQLGPYLDAVHRRQHEACHGGQVLVPLVRLIILLTQFFEAVVEVRPPLLGFRDPDLPLFISERVPRFGQAGDRDVEMLVPVGCTKQPVATRRRPPPRRDLLFTLFVQLLLASLFEDTLGETVLLQLIAPVPIRMVRFVVEELRLGARCHHPLDILRRHLKRNHGDHAVGAHCSKWRVSCLH